MPVSNVRFILCLFWKQ